MNIGVLRGMIYGCIILAVYNISVWIALGFTVMFLSVEVLLSVLDVSSIIAARVSVFLQKIAGTEASSDDDNIQFSTFPLTAEEKKLVIGIDEGDEESLNKFLNSRCTDKSIDFAYSHFPLEHKLAIAEKVLSEVDKKSRNDWANHIDDDDK